LLIIFELQNEHRAVQFRLESDQSGVVLLNAVKEQQQIIIAQQQRVEQQEERFRKQELRVEAQQREIEALKND